MPPDFVRLSDRAPGIAQDIRYAGCDNFMGRLVPGYHAPVCWLRAETAEALARVAERAANERLRLVVWDGYRPQRATDAFVRWAADDSDQATKGRFYPRVDKQRLFADGYIGTASAHSTGAAVDLGLVDGQGALLDFGSDFDLFDPRSATESEEVGADARANRIRLRRLMHAEGFRNYPREWWHYTRPGQPAEAFDAPIGW